MTINKLTDNVKSSDEINKINEIIDGLSNVSVETDNLSITTNSSDELQTIGVIDQNDSTQAIGQWTGTTDEYNEIGTYFAYTHESSTVYVRKVTPTTSDTVYSAVGTTSALTIASVGADSITLSDSYTYNRDKVADEVDDTQYSATTLYNITDDDSADELQALLDEKVDKSSLTDITLIEAPVLIETYVNGTSWYRIYSDGWCEQGGQIDVTENYGYHTINLVKTYSDTNYSIQLSVGLTDYNRDICFYKPSVTTSSFQMYFGPNASDNHTGIWQTAGYLAEGEY